MIKALNVQQVRLQSRQAPYGIYRKSLAHYTANERYTQIEYMYIGQLKSDINFILMFLSHGINSNQHCKSLGKQEAYDRSSTRFSKIFHHTVYETLHTLSSVQKYIENSVLKLSR